MSEERTIPTPARADVVTMTILIDGEPIESSINILGLQVERELNRLPSATVMMRDGDVASEDFPVSSTDTFIPGKEIEIRAGYRSEEETIFKGMIIKHSIRSRRNRGSVLEIECKDKAYKMTLGRKSRYFHEISDSDIMEEIAQSYGLATDVEATSPVHSRVVQYYATDWDFVVARADANGLVVNPVDGGFRIFSPAMTGDPVLQLIYGATILDFESGMDARTQFGSVNAASWDAGEQGMAEIDGVDPAIEEPGNLAPGELSRTAGREEIGLRHGGQRPQDELQAWSDSFLLRSRLSRIRGRVSFQGYSGILPGGMLQLGGMGDRFNGNVFVSSVRHEITRGNWITHCGLGMSLEWHSQNERVVDPPAAGLVPAVNGLQIGIVTVLGSDPEGEDRVQVRMPLIDPGDEGIWARIATLDAGDNRGSFFRPEIGDEVVIGFLNDDPRDPVILGMLNSSAKPAPLQASDDNPEKGFVSRSGMKFLFNDERVSLTMETPNGNLFKLSDDEGLVKIEDENGNSIRMDSNGITLESARDITIKAGGDVKIEGTNIENSAMAQFKGEGSAVAEISSGGQTVIRGSVVQIN